jgi:hypothetical protein
MHAQSGVTAHALARAALLEEELTSRGRRQSGCRMGGVLVPQAIEFVQMQRDDDLWELLITFALGSADLTGAPLNVGCCCLQPTSVCWRPTLPGALAEAPIVALLATKTAGAARPDPLMHEGQGQCRGGRPEQQPI